jgi:hypothetical protein
MRENYDREAVNRLARAVLARKELNEDVGHATHVELEQFDMVARAFHDTPRRARSRRIRRQEPLGFGVEGIAVAITALVLAATADTLSQLAQEHANRTVNRLVSWIRHGLLRRPRPSPEPSQAPESRDGEVPLTAAQARQIHRVTQRHARRLGVPAQTAETIANGIVAELVMARTAPDDAAADSGPQDPEREEEERD